MALSRFIAIATVCAGAWFTTAPLSACEKGQCEKGAKASARPMVLDNHRRKPVATSAARTVKKKNGEYANAAIRARAKATSRSAASRSAPKPAAVASADPSVEPDSSPSTAAILSPAAAQAFASYELARIRVVTPEEITDVHLLADAAASAPNGITFVSADNVQVVSAEDINDIDRKAGTVGAAVSLDTLSRSLAAAIPETTEEQQTWLGRLLMVLGGAFAAVAALVRTVLG